MNKQQFLAELKRLLTYMTSEDRSAVLEDYAARFDDAGESGLSGLLSVIGSPTKVAITLSRGYTPGALAAEWASSCHDRTADAALSVETEAPADGCADAEPTAEPPALSVAVLPVAAPDTDIEDDMLKQVEAAIAAQIDAESDEVSAPTETALSTETSEPSTPEKVPVSHADGIHPVLISSEQVEIPSAPTAQHNGTTSPTEAARLENISPSGGRKVLAAILSVIPGIPLSAVVLAAMLVLIIPGCAAISAAALVAIGGLWASPILMDALLFYGAALCVFALGLVLLWLGIWLDIKLAAIYLRGWKNTRRRILCLPPVEYGALPGSILVWKIFLWLGFVLFVLGLALLAVSMFCGGSITSIRSHGNVDGYIDALRTNFEVAKIFLGF